MIADHFRLVGQIVGIDADAMAADQARTERQEIPLGAGRFQHFQRVDADFVENDGKFVHQRDIQITLGVFDHLGRFRDLDAGRAVDACGDDRFIQLGNQFQGVGIVAGHHLGDGRQGAFLVARIDTLRREADVEIFFPLQAGMFFENGNADFFGRARIHGRLENDDGAFFHVQANRLAGAGQRREVGIVGFVDRSRHGDNDIFCRSQGRRIGADGKMFGRFQLLS